MSDLLQQLQQTTEGLLFPSESDYPVVPFEWPDDAPAPSSPAAFLAAKGYAADTPIQQLDFDTFFSFKIQDREDQDDGQRATARQLGKVVEVLRANLSELRVYKVGNIHFDVFALGQSKDGTWMGVSTEVVET
ncbi:hypothetical protein IAD21_04472 [Abditibacteriota bacterium]|nr:hypothetical protein IAD21_04472 [Abditibacteriota bacterium]